MDKTIGKITRGKNIGNQPALLCALAPLREPFIPLAKGTGGRSSVSRTKLCDAPKQRGLLGGAALGINPFKPQAMTRSQCDGLLLSLDLTAVFDFDLGSGTAAAAAQSFNGLNHIHAFGHATEHDVLAIEPLGFDGRDEELRSVCVRPCVGHAQQAWSIMHELKRLILELLAVNAFTAGTIAAGEVATLEHELRDDPVEEATFEVKILSFAILSFSFFAGAQSAEVFGRTRNIFAEEAHDDSTRILAIDCDVKEDARGDLSLGRGFCRCTAHCYQYHQKSC